MVKNGIRKKLSGIPNINDFLYVPVHELIANSLGLSERNKRLVEINDRLCDENEKLRVENARHAASLQNKAEIIQDNRMLKRKILDALNIVRTSAVHLENSEKEREVLAQRVAKLEEKQTQRSRKLEEKQMQRSRKHEKRKQNITDAYEIIALASNWFHEDEFDEKDIPSWLTKNA